MFDGRWAAGDQAARDDWFHRGAHKLSAWAGISFHAKPGPAAP
ncbi:hypothetical protein [Nonomuraea africana]|uniref:Uncharacterized protein n=1 Tax=Nonomuraea africana TaxID=46171 RepID=A0ABR9KBS9_9ACTN|nr:hypothetical protein [Nonomuraea africana]MBE1559275.1 hypothetical protein [Nonomuraea africana]